METRPTPLQGPPPERRPSQCRPTQGHSRTAAFRQLVREHMAAPPPLLAKGALCGEVTRLMRDTPASSVLIADERQYVIGIITEQDVVRKIAYRCDKAHSVEEFISSPVATIREDDYLYHAIAKMRRHRLRHMPVVNKAGHVTGLLHLHEALAAASCPLMEQIDRLTHDETLEGLAQVKAAQIEIAHELFEEQVAVPEIQALLTQVNNEIYRRILDLHIEALSTEGWAAPPVGFSAIVMGSGGRGESFLFPDQDNGFIMEDYPDSQHASIDGYFIELAERLTASLNQIGIRFCRGYVMATNPLWRKSLSQWRGQLRYWVTRATPAILNLADIFFDFAPVYGQDHLAHELRQTITGSFPRQHRFLAEMQGVQDKHGVALGLFGRLTPDLSPGPHKGKLNLKYHGLLPLVEAVRLLALREGVAETSTVARIDVLAEQEFLSRDEQEYLKEAFNLLTRLILRQQLMDFAAGKEVSAYAPLSALSALEVNMLKDSLHAVKTLKDRIRTEFTAHIF